MRKNKKLLSFMLAVTMVAGSVSVPGTRVNAKEKTKEYVVLAKNNAGYDKAEEVCLETETEVAEELEENHILVGKMTETEAAELEQDKDIILVEEDILFEASDYKDKKHTLKEENEDESEDTEILNYLKPLKENGDVSVEAEKQWNINMINANESEYENGTEEVKVAIMDTGVTASEDIDVVGRVNLIEGEEDVNPLFEDVSGHGTSVASVIAAKDNDIGVTGINPNVELYSIKALYDDNTTTLSKVVQGIYWCIENDIDIINMSFGTSVKSEVLEEAIKEADEAGILLIAAAGNRGETTGSNVEYPAAFEEVIAVGAINPNGEKSDISSTGAELELMAPGESVPATGYFNEIIKTEGTSMSAPHVAGVASVLWAKDKNKSNKFIRELLNVSAKQIDEEEYGVVDLEYALSVYDEFAENYNESTEEMNNEIIPNDEKIEVFDETEVNASWGTANHQSAVGALSGTALSVVIGAEVNDYPNDTVLNIIKIGAKIPDSASYLKFSAGGTDSFHGHYNYIANYMYVMRMAKICSTKGMTTALSTAKYPCTGAGEAQIYNGLVELNKHWSTILSGYNVNNKNKARVLVGIATHIAMDTYAHKAYIKDSAGKWTVHISGDANQDSTTYVPNRWTCAKSAASDIILVWCYGIAPRAYEYYQTDHSSSKFRLFKFNTYCKSANKAVYEAEKSWYDNRTAD